MTSRSGPLSLEDHERLKSPFVTDKSNWCSEALDSDHKKQLVMGIVESTNPLFFVVWLHVLFYLSQKDLFPS